MMDSVVSVAAVSPVSSASLRSLRPPRPSRSPEMPAYEVDNTSVNIEDGCEDEDEVERLRSEHEAAQLKIIRLESKLEELQRLQDVQEDELHQKLLEIEAAQKETLEMHEENLKLTQELEAERHMVTMLKEKRVSWTSVSSATTGKDIDPVDTVSAQTLIDRTLQMKCDQYEHEIESLRIDLADLHLKAVRSEDTYSSHVQTMQENIAQLLVQNTKLTEEIARLENLRVVDDSSIFPNPGENSGDISSSTMPHDRSDESVIVPVSSRNGGFNYDELRNVSSLAEEILATAGDDVDKTPKQFLDEYQKVKEKNMSMAAYIERIIQKLLENEALEYILESEASTSTNMRSNEFNKGLSPPRVLPKGSRNRNVPSISSASSGSTRTPSPSISGTTSIDSEGSSTRRPPLSTRRRTPIGIGINIELSQSTEFSDSRSTLSVQNSIGPPSSSPSFTPKLGVPLSPSARRVSSTGQTSMLPLKLAGSATPTSSESELVPTEPTSESLSPNPVTPTASASTTPRRRASNWLGFLQVF
ncbi:uncharacterized protein V1516DRAFT_705893 [Lipomyces oligophaga]|uniref:uncharacterized protein n=1 Tax=Lipomyces oligophaga TaxID=45792 RepID=UPI0034CECD18